MTPPDDLDQGAADELVALVRNERGVTLRSIAAYAETLASRGHADAAIAVGTMLENLRDELGKLQPDRALRARVLEILQGAARRRAVRVFDRALDLELPGRRKGNGHG